MSVGASDRSIKASIKAWRALDILANAQAAVTAKLRTHGRAMLLAGLVPAAAATFLFIWTVEAYWAAIGFPIGGFAVLGSALAIGFALTSLVVGRMVRLALDLEAASNFPRGFSVGANDLHVALTTAALFLVAGVTFVLWRAIELVIAAAFIAPGSEAIALPVEALARAGVLIAMFYLSGRLAILIPAIASGDGIKPSAAWQATEGHASILFIVCLGVPSAVGLVFIAPVLMAIGALPWPAPDAFGRIEAMVSETRRAMLFLGPLLFLGLITAWMFAAAGLACAWQALKDSGASHRAPG
jgi:hypothetical protein